MTVSDYRTESTLYFPGEGREYMQSCIDAAFRFAADNRITSIVMFTATGDGPLYAVEHLMSESEYLDIEVVAITPPHGKRYRVEVGNPNSEAVPAGIANPARRKVLTDAGVSIHAAHLPFKPIETVSGPTSELGRIADAYGILGGGFALCVQAALMACDAGAISPRERVIACTADTALVALASRTDMFLSPTHGLLIEHVICRPMRYSLTKPDHWGLVKMWGGQPAPRVFEAEAPQLPLPEPAVDAASKEHAEETDEE